MLLLLLLTSNDWSPLLRIFICRRKISPEFFSDGDGGKIKYRMHALIYLFIYFILFISGESQQFKTEGSECPINEELHVSAILLLL